MRENTAIRDLMAIGGKDLQETPVTDTVKVNTTVLGSQFSPAVTALSGGGYIIVWEDSSSGQIFAQRFSATGAKVGNELHLDSVQGGSPLWVSVAATANDGFVIAFQAGSFNNAEIFARRYDSLNNPVGGLFAANTTSPNEQYNPHVTALDNGGLLFTWDTRVTLGNDVVAQEVRGRIYDSSGQPIGNDFAIAPVTATDLHGLSAITAIAGGGFVVTWQRAANSGANFEIVGQRYNSSGGTVGSQFQANAQTTNNQYGNDVARLSDGGFVVSWVDPGNGNVGGRVVARHYDASGNAIGGEIVIDSKASGTYGRTTVTATANGSYVVSWTEDDGTAAQNNVLARQIGANDVPVGAAFEMSFNSPFGANYFSDGAVTLSNGNVVFTWDGPSVTPPGGQGTGQDIYMRLYSFDTVPPPNTPTEGDDVLTDTAGSDTINALGGSDSITVTNGRDTVNGGSGNDLLVLNWGDATGSVNSDGPNVDAGGGFSGFYSEGAVQIASRMVAYGQIERFNITTGSGADDVVTGSGNDEVRTGAGDDRVDVRGGVNIADGGADVDAISADLSALVGGVTIDLNNAVNSGAYGSFSNFEYFGTMVGTGLGDTFVTTSLTRNDTVNSGGGDDMVTVFNGADRVNAGAGTDTLRIDWRSTTQAVTHFQAPTANPNGGFDGRYYAGVINFPDRDITYTEVERFEILTGSADDIIITASGNDYIDGGSGADTMTGLGGNDIYVVDNANDVVTEAGGGGTDEVRTNLASYTLAANVENLTGTLATGQALTGNGLANIILGAAGNDMIDGGAGADTMAGGVGNDTYIIDDAGDVVTEQSGQGTDEIRTAIAVFSMAAMANIENLTGTSASAQSLTGNAGANAIVGGAGADSLFGGAGNDIITASWNDTILDGGGDYDTLILNGSGTVAATISGFEALTLGGGTLTMTGSQLLNGFSTAASGTSSVALAGTGSLIINLGAANTEFYLTQITGGTGIAFTINGSAIDDVIKGAMNSTNIINGGDGGDFLRGGSLADVINGGNGNDKIDGGAGADMLTGGAGADQFRFTSANASGLGAAADRVADFVAGTDRLGFGLIDADAVAPGDQAFSFLGTGAFTNTGIGQIRYQNSGADLLVQVDVDGNGTADMEIILQGLNGQTLTSGDFIL